MPYRNEPSLTNPTITEVSMTEVGLDIRMVLSLEHFKMWLDAENPKEVLLDLLHEAIQTSHGQWTVLSGVPRKEILNAYVSFLSELLGARYGGGGYFQTEIHASVTVPR